MYLYVCMYVHACMQAEMECSALVRTVALAHRLLMPWMARRYVWIYIIYVHIVYIYTYTHSGISGTWLIRMCDMTQSYVWHEAFTCVTTNTHCIGVSALSAHALGDTQVCVYVCYTHIYIDSFLRGTWLIRTWLIRTCDMTHSWTR